MIRWSQYPDKVFQDVVTNSLVYYKCGIEIGDISADLYELVEALGSERTIKEIEGLLAVHKLDKIYQVTDYFSLVQLGVGPTEVVVV